MFFFFSSRRRHTRCLSDWSSDVCSSDLWFRNPRNRRGDIMKLRKPGVRENWQEKVEALGFTFHSLNNLYWRSEEHTSELQSLRHLVCRLLLEKKKKKKKQIHHDKSNLRRTAHVPTGS